MDVSLQANVVCSVGMTGSGKSYYVKQCLIQASPERVLIFDPEGEYGEFGHVVEDERELVKAVQLPRFAVVFYPSMFRAKAEQQFNLCCQIAFELASRAGRTVTFVVDELQQVTSASKAPEWWGALVRRGRKYGVTVYAAAQRPAEIDKTIYSNCTRLRTGFLGYPEDQITIAKAMGIPAADIGALSGHQWIMRDIHAGITRG